MHVIFARVRLSENNFSIKRPPPSGALVALVAFYYLMAVFRCEKGEYYEENSFSFFHSLFSFCCFPYAGGR